MKATLTFSNRAQAEDFSTKWTRFSKCGTMIGSGLENVEVTVWDIDKKGKKFIDDYVSKIN